MREDAERNTPPQRAARSAEDRVLRAITDDDNFRVVVAVTTNTVRGAVAAQEPSGTAAGHFADLITGTVLVRETMSPAYRVQTILKGAGGRGTLIADAHPDGMTRGIVRLGARADIDLSAGSTLQVMRNVASGKIFRSLVEPPANGTVADALMAYLQNSEQVVSVIAAGTSATARGVEYAGGYVVQLLPGAKRGPLMVMTERLAAMPSVGELLVVAGGDALGLLKELLFGMPYAQLDETTVHHGCSCGEEAVLATLATLPRADIADLSRGDEPLELSCDYCRVAYRVPPAQLRGLLTSS
ncbi:MAG: Hsp33 family molecular chaperone HslO [Myxococcales bacterium]|nr:Hsp33 family molecular chaperone HslO [Myxococcales bacterium]